MTDPASQPPSHVRHQVVALATLMAVLLYLDRYVFSIVERDIKKDLNLSNEDMGWLLSAFFWAYAFGQVPSGWLSDRFGARLMLAVYILGWSLFTGWMGLASSFALLFALRFGCGFLQAGAYPTSGNLLSKWVSFRERGLASGIVATGGRIGGVAAPVLTTYLLLAFKGWSLPSQFLPDAESPWRVVMIVYGLAGIVVAALFWLWVRDQPRDHPACNDAELAVIDEGRPAGSTSPHGRAGTLPMGALLSSFGLWLSALSQFWTNFGWMFLLTWFPRYLAEVKGVPSEERGWMVGTPIFVGIVGMLCGGWLTDVLARHIGVRWGRALPMALTRFVATAGYTACLVLDSPWAVTAALCVVAFFTDLGVPAVWAYMQDAGGKHVGTVLGWGNMWGNLGAALSPVILNEVIQRYGWPEMFLVCAAAFLFSGLAALGIDATIPIIPDEIKEPAPSDI